MSLFERVRRSLFWPMLRKEFIQMRRDRVTLAMMVVLPAIQLVLFGYAIQTEVRHLPTLVFDESRTSDSRALVQVLENTGNFRVVGAARNREEIAERIGRGEVSAALVIPPEFATDLKRGRGAQAQMIVDAADPLSSSAALSGATLAGRVYAAQIRGDVRVTPLEVRVRPWYNPALRSAAFIVPGIIGVLLSITLILITSIAIVRERERGTLEQLIVTPIGKTSLMLGKLIPFVLVGYVQMTVILVLGRLLFNIPIRGSLLALYVASFAFVVANLGIGLLLSTRARNQLQAMQLGFFLIMPSILLSGFMFPRQAMPPAAQWLGLVLPLTYYLEILRGILLKGVGLDYLWRPVLVLVVYALAMIVLSVRRFTKTIE